jgi:predicted ATPase/DNA-binding CsgD family transcriptional regulator
MNNTSIESDVYITQPLTQREMEILSLFATGQSNRAIADQLSLALSTVKWYARQIYTKLGVNSRDGAVSRAKEIGLLESDIPRHNLPSQTTPFIGRDRELAEIQRLITDPKCRLLILTGLGGIGKTRLSIETASNMYQKERSLFQDGVYFISLTPVVDSSSIVTAIADTLKFSFYEGKESPRQQLFDYLRQKKLLLVLDDFEHLINEESTCLIHDILSASLETKILVTSRERINALEEQVFPVSGMIIPEIGTSENWQKPVEDFNTYESIQLFWQTAQRVRPGFQITTENLPSIVGICRTVDGMPLGIELAASWVEALETDAILTEIKRSIDFLETDMYTLPERQRSLRAVFDTSWNLLEEGERQAIQTLTVFHDGFTHLAASQVGNVTLKTLLSLVSKSWMQHGSDGRFHIHDLLRKYANIKLNANANECQRSHSEHSVFYCDLLYDRKIDLQGSHQQQALVEIECEIENIQAAWKWAVITSRIDLIERALYSLCAFYDVRGRFEDGEAMCSMASEKFSELSSGDQDGSNYCLPVWARVLAWQSRFTQDVEISNELLHKSQEIINCVGLSDDRHKEAQVLTWYRFGRHFSWNDRLKAKGYFLKSLEMSRELGDKWSEARSLSDLGWVAWVTGAFDEAERMLNDSLKIQEEIGDQRGAADSLNMMAVLVKHLGRLEEAQRLHLESLAILEKLGAKFEIAIRLYALANAMIMDGKFDEGLQYAHQSLRDYNELGYDGPYKAKPYIVIAEALMHLSHYSQSRLHAQEALRLSRENESPQDVGLALLMLGNLALVEKSYAEAEKHLQESYLVLKEIEQNMCAIPLIILSYVESYLGQTRKAQGHLLQTLEPASDSKHFFNAIQTIPAAALLAVGLDDVKWAVELYAMACRYPYIGKSHWYDAVAWKEISQAALSLPADVIKAAQARGNSLDFWDTTEQLTTELRENK